MESSDAETGMVDCAVGTIVWVRRRNGSWWPGKILGPDELSASHLMSPRSGTPVKLLGREDASVDWYNLEKSKRVKPFRCGEFDDCIERAEASQGMPPKKREKYARREDAILHALELEKQVLEKKYGKSGGNGLSTKLAGKDTSITPERFDNGKHVDPSVDDKRKGLSLQSRNDKSPDIRPPSFRGLQGLGAGIPFKHKLSSLNGSHRHAAAPDDENTVTKKLLEKRKRLQEEESVGKRRDRHRPLVQVLQSSAKSHPTNTNTNTHLLKSKADGGEEHREEVVHPAVGVNDPEIAAGEDSFDHRETLADQVDISAPKSKSFPVASLSEDHNTTGSNEDTETDSSGTESLISDTYDAMALLSDEGEEDMEFIPKAFGRQEAHAGMSDDNDLSGGVPDDSVAKWQLKGKRNSRSSRKRNSSHWMMGFKGEGGGYNNHIRNRGGGGLLDMSWDDDDDDDDDEGWDDEYKCRMLIDVEVGVQSGYQREHVPMISLMSKLNDKAIVGHPIPVEALEDGSSDVVILAGPTPWRRTAKSRPPHLQEKEEEDDGDGCLMNRKGRKSKKQPQRRSASSSFSSQKIRTLSSIGGTHQQQQQSMDMKEAGEGRMMKLKPESLPTAVACIPVKLVFSRLHEELLVARHQ